MEASAERSVDPVAAREAFEIAVAAQTRKERTVSEMEDLLLARGVAEPEMRDAVERLTEIGELDDEHFAQVYAEDKRDLRGWGPERIREALVTRGIDRRLAEAATSGESHGQQVDRAASLLVARRDPPVDDATRSKALAYLSRRGYDYDVAYEAVRRVGSSAA